MRGTPIRLSARTARPMATGAAGSLRGLRWRTPVTMTTVPAPMKTKRSVARNSATTARQVWSDLTRSRIANR